MFNQVSSIWIEWSFTEPGNSPGKSCGAEYRDKLLHKKDKEKILMQKLGCGQKQGAEGIAQQKQFRKGFIHHHRTHRAGVEMSHPRTEV